MMTIQPYFQFVLLAHTPTLAFTPTLVRIGPPGLLSNQAKHKPKNPVYYRFTCPPLP